jgi:hypothetical protein
MKTRTFIGEFKDDIGKPVRMEIAVNLAAIHHGKFEFTFVGDIARARQVEQNEYLAWIKSTMSQLSVEFGKSIAFFSISRDNKIAIIISSERDGAVKEERKEI